MKRITAISLCLILAAMLQGCSSKATDNSGTAYSASTPAPGNARHSEPEDGLFFYSSTDTSLSNAPEPGMPSEEYLTIIENDTVDTSQNSMLTFSLKVDTASYRNVVRYIENNSLPPSDAVRIEEMINYFSYDQPLEFNDTPFSVYTELGDSPFSADKKLAYVRVKSKDIDMSELPPSNLTFLIDVSGSMDSYDKLPLLKSAFGLLVETLGSRDYVSIVTYSGDCAIALDSARGDEKETIMNVINSLRAGGSTAGGGGIQAAYKLAENNFIKGGNNRVILATDGDFNVGVSSVEELEKLISKKRDTGVYLSVLGVGTGNIKDSKMETLAKNGNGNYNYLDSVSTAKKVLVDELGSNIFVIADDVKAQVEFNPMLVSEYRLIGYENRQLQNRDFADDRKDAGEIGVGTDVVVMFEITLKSDFESGLKYSVDKTEAFDLGEYGDEFFEVRIRYKNPDESESKLITIPVKTDRMLSKNTSDFKFASSVAAFGHLLNDSQYKGGVKISDIIDMARENLGRDDNKLRKDFVQIVKEYERISR